VQIHKAIYIYPCGCKVTLSSQQRESIVRDERCTNHENRAESVTVTTEEIEVV
jgi:hypothetical protein